MVSRGVKAVESLHHVAFECPEYDELRQEHVVRGIVASREVGIFLFCIGAGGPVLSSGHCAGSGRVWQLGVSDVEAG